MKGTFADDFAAATSRLIVTADDYGYAPGYDQGILAAARAGAVDAVGAMAHRGCEPGPLLATGVEVGLHLEAGTDLAEQVEAFERTFGRSPAYLDGHHHCHARDELAVQVIRFACRAGIPVRSVSSEHRRALREAGVATPDRLLGRLREDEPPLPGQIAVWLAGGVAPAGLTEWMLHPGHPDPSTGSRYDRGRAEDLALLLELGDRGAWREHGIERGGPSAATVEPLGPR